MEQRRRGRPVGPVKADPGDYRNRYSRHYYAHRDELNAKKRLAYQERRAKGLCVRCLRKALHGIVFCRTHAPPHKPVIQKILRL
jgi:hypothetical protein